MKQLCLLLSCLLLLSSCKKDAEIRLYPKTYRITGHSSDYTAWIYNRDMAASIPASYFFNTEWLFDVDYSITLVNDHQLTGLQTDTTPYFFRNDSLFAWMLPAIIPGFAYVNERTLQYICPGNYDFLCTTSSFMAYGQKGNATTMPAAYFIRGYVTKESYCSFLYGDPNKVMDTLVIYHCNSYYK